MLLAQRRARPLAVCASSNARHDHHKPRRTLRRVLDICRHGSVRDLLPYLPSPVLSRCLQLAQSRTSPSPAPANPALFQQVIDGMLLTRPSEHFLDTWALRLLVIERPTCYEELSELMVGPDRYVARCAVTACTGEESVLTFSLARNARPPSPPELAFVDAAPMGPPGDDDSIPASGAGSVWPWPVWRLESVRGEPRIAVLPETPSPEFPPEAVVEAQLRALQAYEFARAFTLLSPAAQALVGPIDRFIASMGRSRLYRPLVAHRDAVSLRRCQASASVYLEVVAVEGGGPPGPPQLHCWVVRKQQGPDGVRDCWATEWVKVVDDPKLRAVLGLPAQA